MFFKIATDRHSCQQTNALKQLKNDIGFVGLVRRTASKLFKVKNRELDPATPCVRGWPWYHTWWWVKGIWSVLTHEHDTQGPSWGYSVLCQFWLFLIYWLSYACAMTEIMSRAKLHVYLLRKKEISKSFMLHQLPRCVGSFVHRLVFCRGVCSWAAFDFIPPPAFDFLPRDASHRITKSLIFFPSKL